MVTSAPPGRTSIFSTLQRAGEGTHHCSKLAGLVQAAHIAARGALMMRVISRSRSGSSLMA
jgi:hypothetical protein